MEKETQGNVAKPSIFGMILSPSEQLGKVRETPRIWIPLLIVTLLYTIASIILAVSMTVEDIIVPGISVEEAELFLGFTKITTAVSGVIAPIFSILVSTVIYLIIIKIFKKDATFKQLFSMNTHITFIGAIGLLLNNIIQSAIGGKVGIYVTSLAGLLNSDSLVLATFEVFSIWTVVLTAIGLQKVGKLSKGAAWTFAIAFFLVSVGMAALGAAFEGIAGM